MHSLNRGSSMNMASKGKKSALAQRLKMPWTKSTETLNFRFLNYKDKTILDGHEINYGIERMAQLDPLEVLKGAVAMRQYLTVTGCNVFQLASQLQYFGRGQQFYRKEWKEGTYDKYITLSNIEFERDTGRGKVYGYYTFHGETSLEPIEVQYAEFPGWVVEFDPDRAVPFNEVVKAPPSIGTEVPVDPKKYRLKSYPYYTPPNPSQFVHKLLVDRGVLPDPALQQTQVVEPGTEGGQDPSDHSEEFKPKE